ncbi:MAG: hypothetical protein CMK59_08715 [Proteobacteria bacterium]|nr:hypothetical protein [Pseudomonadota bacterium]
MTKTKGYLDLLKVYPNFRRLYAAEFISLLGDWFNLIAILSLLREIGADSASAFGGALILKSLPSILVAPHAGVYADRFSRRNIMITADVIRMIVVLAMFGTLLIPSAYYLYALLLLQSACSGFFQPARAAILPSLVEREDLPSANALGATTWSLMLTVGVALGGLVTEYFGWQIALLVDAATYLISACFLIAMVEPVVQRSEGDQVIRFSQAFEYLSKHLEVLRLVCVKAAWNCAGAITLMLTILGERRFSSGDGAILGVTALYMARGLGTGIGPILGRSISRNSNGRFEILIGVGFVLGLVFFIGVGHAPTLWLACICLIPAHIGGSMSWVFSTVRLQQELPEYIRGRVFALEQAGFIAMFVVTNAVYGWLIDTEILTVSEAFTFMAMSMALPALAWYLTRKRI